jgi:uncharacterized protein YjbI with pentapeptide repeats
MRRLAEGGLVIRLAGRCGVVAVAFFALSPPAHAESGTSIAHQLRHETDVVLDRVTVIGPLQLRGANVHGLFICRACTFEGRVVASDATFYRTVDLSGSRFDHKVDFSGARFEGPALFRTAFENEEVKFADTADFSFATFSDIASFFGSRFDSVWTFRDARFLDAVFSDAEFRQAGSFERASFRGTATFNRARFRGDAAPGLDEPPPTADFAAADFAKGAAFLATRFELTQASDSVRFLDVTANGSMNFTLADFQTADLGNVDVRVLAVFEDVLCTQSLDFTQSTFQPGQRLTLHRVNARDVELDLKIVRQVDSVDDQAAILRKIEESETNRGNLADANNAHYELLALKSDGYPSVWRYLDRVFYRGIAGYFVRPFRPLLTLVALALVFSLIRYLRQPVTRLSVEGSHLHTILRSAGTRSASFANCFFDTLASIGRGGRGNPDGQPPGAGARIEVLIYRVLLACALIGLANSNPTLREMFDTLV